MAGSLRLSGNQFHIAGLATETRHRGLGISDIGVWLPFHPR